MKKDERKKGNKNLNHMYFFHAVYAQLKASGKNIRGVKDTMAMSNWNIVKSAPPKVSVMLTTYKIDIYSVVLSSPIFF